MTDIAFDSSHLNLRIAGICMHDGHVLLTWDEKEDFWTLPGGRPHLHEPSGDALVREMEEEIATRVDVLRLLWIVENFFEYFGAHFHGNGSLPEGNSLICIHGGGSPREGAISLATAGGIRISSSTALTSSRRLIW